MLKLRLSNGSTVVVPPEMTEDNIALLLYRNGAKNGEHFKLGVRPVKLILRAGRPVLVAATLYNEVMV